MGENNEISFDHIPESPYINWVFISDQFGLEGGNEKTSRLQSSMQDFFDPLDIEATDISGVRNHQEQNYIVLAVGETLYFFDIYSEQFCGNTLEQANEFREQNPTPEVQTILTGIPVLQELMERNNEDGFFGSYLTHSDSVDFESPEFFSGMTARELQMTLRGNIQIFEEKGGLLGIDERQRSHIARLYRTYMEIVMGIGDSYEPGSAFFYKTEQEIDRYITISIAAHGNISESVDYFSQIHTNIYENVAISRPNRQAYALFTQKMGQVIFELLRENINNTEGDDQEVLLQESLRFIEILRGREQEHTLVHRDMRNPLLAEEVCIFLISREGGVLDSIEQCSRYNLDFSDPVVGERTPQEIILQTESKLQECGFENPSFFLQQSFGIRREQLVGVGGEGYNDLNLNNKRVISMLARLIEKINAGEIAPETIKGMSLEESQAYVLRLGNEITSEAFEAVREAYDRNFESDTYGGRPIYIPPDFVAVLEDIGVHTTQIQAFELFNDIRGNDMNGWDGILNFSDENLNLAGSLGRSAAIIVGTIAVVMLATYATGGLTLPALARAGLMGESLISSGSLTTTGSLVSIGTGSVLGTAANQVFDPRSHDSVGGMLADVGTDLVVNTFHAIYMERLTMRLWGQYGLAGKSGLILGDLGSGISLEVVRDMSVDRIFNSDPLLGEVHSYNIEDIFWGLNYQGISGYISPEIDQRFQHATDVFYRWNGHDVDIPSEPEFSDIDWNEGNEILSAIELWIQRQENRV